MKNRRFTIVAFLLVAVVAMSVGFAVVSHELQIGGNVYLGPDTNFKVKFVDPELDTTTPDATDLADNSKATIHVVTNTDDAKLQITLASGAITSSNNKATFKVKVVNSNAEHRAQLTAPTVSYNNNADTYLTVTPSGITDSTILGLSNDSDTTDEATLTILVEVDELPADTTELTFSISFIATAITKTEAP